MGYKLDRSFFIPKNGEIIAQSHTNNAIVYGDYSVSGKIHAIAFQGKADKPAWNYVFKNEEQRDEYINNWFMSLISWDSTKKQWKRERQEAINNHDIKPGDYFCHSWGYDQTNIDYLIVVRLTNKTAICRMVSPILVDQEAQQDVLMPGSAYGESFRMKISGKDSLVGSYPYCKGDKMRGYFYKTSLTRLQRQTNPLFGH